MNQNGRPRDTVFARLACGRYDPHRTGFIQTPRKNHGDLQRIFISINLGIKHRLRCVFIVNFVCCVICDPTHRCGTPARRRRKGVMYMTMVITGRFGAAAGWSGGSMPRLMSSLILWLRHGLPPGAQLS